VARYEEEGVFDVKAIIETSSGGYVFSFKGIDFSAEKLETRNALARSKLKIDLFTILRTIFGKNENFGTVSFTDGTAYAVTFLLSRRLRFSDSDGREILRLENRDEDKDDKDAIVVAELDPPPPDDHLSVLLGAAWVMGLHRSQ